MRLPRIFKFVALAVVGMVILVAGVYFYAITPHRISAPPDSAQGLLERADSLAWDNCWAEAAPLYKRAQGMFLAQGKLSKALYSQVSQIPSNESLNLPSTIWMLTKDLNGQAAADPETRLRILTIRGMLETNYNAAEALTTWEQVSSLATRLGHFDLATRAMGEEGIASFILGDAATAKKKVIRAWMLSKIEHDPAATVRYASVYGDGLVAVHRYKEALTPLNEAIRIAAAHPAVAYPAVAINGKIDALIGLDRFHEALALANQSVARLQGTLYNGEKAQVYIYRGAIYQARGNWDAAIADYRTSLGYSEAMDDYRGVADVEGLLAEVYEQKHNLPAALAAIDSAIAANTKIPEELYLAPRNLAVKAEIENKMGHPRKAEVLYLKGVTLVDTMIRDAPTVKIERRLLTEMSDVYSGYFAVLCAQKRYGDALRILEEIRGRVETEALEHHKNQTVHAPTPEEERLTHLNIALIDTNDPAKRKKLSQEIYDTELFTSPSPLAQETIDNPAPLAELQQTLSPHALLLEYLLAEPNSYVLAVTDKDVTAYRLPAKSRIQAEAKHYTAEMRAKKEDMPLAQSLYQELLGPVRQYANKSDLIIVPDGSLDLLPFAALAQDGSYVLSTHTVDVVPSATVFCLLRKRAEQKALFDMSFLGVAAFTQVRDTRSPIVRAVFWPERSELVPLPESRIEVESVAKYLPPPDTILLGAKATKANFVKLASDGVEVIHLALHAYVNLEYPNRSALIFAPSPSGASDGLLQVSDIRKLHLTSRLVTLSACSTGVGPVGEVGVDNLANAFIEAGSDSVVSTLWDVEDESTAHFMIAFYSHLAAHSRKIDALRAAQLDMLRKGFPPYYWAGFQMVGDPDGRL